MSAVKSQHYIASGNPTTTAGGTAGAGGGATLAAAISTKCDGSQWQSKKQMHTESTNGQFAKRQGAACSFCGRVAALHHQRLLAGGRGSGGEGQRRRWKGQQRGGGGVYGRHEI